jgi:hypothetical protein
VVDPQMSHIRGALQQRRRQRVALVLHPTPTRLARMTRQRARQCDCEASWRRAPIGRAERSALAVVELAGAWDPHSVDHPDRPRHPPRRGEKFVARAASY